MRYLILKKILSVVLLTFFILASAAYSQQGSEQSAQSSEAESAEKPKSTDKIFKPSEEISEDSPVPFPVDI